MIPPAAALATALAASTAQDWRWMECEDGVQYATLRLPCGAAVTVTAPAHTAAETVAQQAQEAIAEKLKSQGYRFAAGGGGDETRGLPILSALVGKSDRQIRRILRGESSSRTDGREQMETDRQAAARALDRFRRRHGEGLTPGQAAAIRKALDVLDALAQ